MGGKRGGLVGCEDGRKGRKRGGGVGGGWRRKKKGGDGKGFEGGLGKEEGREKRTTAEPMIIHLATVSFDVIILRFPFCDLEVFSRYDDVGGAGAAGPFLTVEAVAAAEGGGGGLVWDGCWGWLGGEDAWGE